MSLEVFKTNLKYIYVTRDSFSKDMDAWDPNVGIKKFDGCFYFCSANSTDGLSNNSDNNIGYHLSLKDLGLTKRIPAGSAWLVNTTSGVWERVDQDMYLLNSRGEIIDEEISNVE